MTSLRYLLDTNIIIYIRQRRPLAVLDRLRRIERGEAAISVVTYGELVHGIAKAGSLQSAWDRLAVIMDVVAVLPLSEEAARAYGVLRSDLERRGAIIGANDLWIAAHALAAGLTLVTNNVREFARVPDLAVENWAAG